MGDARTNMSDPQPGQQSVKPLLAALLNVLKYFRGDLFTHSSRDDLFALFDFGPERRNVAGL